MGLCKEIIVGLIVCFITGGIAVAQQPEKYGRDKEYRLVNWNSENGLIYGRVNCMLKDKNGFLWIGTEKALNRFDGSIFKNYLDPKSKNQKTAGNFINSLIEDSLHNIWVGTDKGLSRYDIKADTFKNFLPAPISASSNTSIIPFWATKTELLCIESDSIITSYNSQSFEKKKIARLSQKIGNNTALPLSVFEAKTNCVWMLPLDDEGGLMQISLSNGKQVRYTWSGNKNKPHSGPWGEGMCYDRDRNCIWINAGEGLFQFTLGDSQFHQINAVKDFFNRGVGISIDTKNRLWVGTGDKGIFIYDPATRAVNRPFAGDSVLQKEANSQNYRIYCDRDGTTWVGYWVSLGKGINQLIPFSKVVYRYPGNINKPDSFISSYGYMVQKAAGGRIWVFGTELYILNPNTGLFSVLRKKDLQGIKNDKTVSFIAVSKVSKNAWLTGDQTGEFFEMDIASKQCRPIVIKDTANRRISHLNFAEHPNGEMVNKKETIFWGEISGNKQGVFILNPDSSAAHQLPGLPSENIEDLFTDGDHLIFLRRHGVSTNLTYTLINGTLSRTPTPLDTIAWNNIVFNNKDQTWWVGAFMQLVHYTKNFRLIRRYTQKDGLPVINVSGIQPDNKGNIWFNTERSISELNPETGNITTLSEKQGWLQQPYHSIPVTKDDAGDLYFLGFDGLDRIKPYNLRINFPPSSVYLKSLETDQNAIPLMTGVNNLAHLSLKYFQNRISIETGIIDFYSKGASRMRYKLEPQGEAGTWQYGPANYTIRFEGLRPGSYVLRMQASNAALQFNGPEKVLLIIISPPWWQTWWSWALYVVVFVTAVYAFIAYRSRKLVREKRLLEEKVTVRTKQLSEANKELSEQQEEITTQRDQLSVTLTDLKATQKQLIQSEKMASLGELTAGIAHEIQNPLNFVNNFSDVSIELLDEMEEELDKGDKEEAMAIAGDIRHNLEKINHHGKRADNIVKGMLQHSKSSTGIKELTDINALADEYIRLAYHGLRSKDKTFNAEMVTSLDSKLPKVNVVPQDIGRIMLNLFNNAFYAVNQKKKIAGIDYKPEVAVTTTSANGQVIIKVKDNGIGIPDAIKEKIMQPFFTTKPTGEGTGLGLSLTYDMVVKGYGGNITVDSKEGGFTEFIIELPLN